MKIYLARPPNCNQAWAWCWRNQWQLRGTYKYWEHAVCRNYTINHPPSDEISLPFYKYQFICPHVNRNGHYRYRYLTNSTVSSSADSDNNNNGGKIIEGARLYRRYLELQVEIDKLEKMSERQKSEKMYQAWKEATADVVATSTCSDQTIGDDSDNNFRNTSGNKRMAGVAVVRTIAKETKKTHLKKIDELKKESAELLNSAADSFHYPPAMVQLGNDALAHDLQVAMAYYKSAGGLGSAEGWFNLGHCLWEQSGGDANDVKSAFAAFWKAANLGDRDAMYFLGVHLLGSQGSDVSNMRKGLELVQQAADQNHSGALHYLVLFYRNGNDVMGVEPSGSREFMDRLEKAIEHDANGESYFLRGSCYLCGDVYEKSPAKALKDFLIASELGQSEAAVSAGALFYNGVKGQISQDHRRAFELYQHAGELGNLEGWRNVVACYLQGHGVPQSTSIANYIAETMLRTNDRQ